MSNELKSLSPTEAWEICQKNSRALLIDVRSSMEHLFVGHPVGAVHVPWIDEPEWVGNPHFVTDIRKLILGGVVGDDEFSTQIFFLLQVQEIFFQGFGFDMSLWVSSHADAKIIFWAHKFQQLGGVLEAVRMG